MFLFQCCQEFQTGVGYELEKKNGRQKSFVNNLKEIDPKELHHDENRIVKIKKSEYEELYTAYSKSGKQFVDDQFPADDSSLGEIEGIKDCRWKRITDIIKSPPNRVVHGSLGDCYLLSALAALAEQEDAIRTIFGNQEYTPSGIYRILAKIHGQIQEIVVDDYIPVNHRGEPLFCQTNNNQFWVLILQKAWAKIHGSYANIIMGNPTEVFTTFTFAPAAMMLVKDKQEDREKQWSLLSDYTKQHFPICCNTHEQTDTAINLSPAHSYTLLDTAILEDMQGEHHKLVKLRDPWSKGIWTGTASIDDGNFWAKIVNSPSKHQFCKQMNTHDNGIFCLTFKDFTKYFSQIHYCLYQKNSNYISEQLLCNRKNGSLFEVEIHKRGLYSFELNQSELQQQGQQDRKEEGACRATLLLIRNNTNSNFDFVNGLLKYNDEDAVLTEQLDPGHYLLFAKIDPTSHNCIPANTVVSIYSTCFTVLQPTQQTKYPSLLKSVFLKHARSNKRNKYNNGLMWISWKLLFQQGGYAYVAMGVDANSNKKFIIDFQEDEFQKMNFKLKGEYKNKGNQRIQIHPGEEKIILARVNNATITSLKFPPQLGIKMQLIE